MTPITAQDARNIAGAVVDYANRQRYRDTPDGEVLEDVPDNLMLSIGDRDEIERIVFIHRHDDLIKIANAVDAAMARLKRAKLQGNKP